jgi:hypothetical protein
MPTINELPVATSVSAADEVLVSQDGTTRSVSIGDLLVSTQPAIMAPTGSLLGRVSVGAGGPESVAVGSGLVLSASTVQANGTDHGSFVSQTMLQTTDQAVLNSNGRPMLLELSLLRGLFSAGANVTIDGAGVISVASNTGDGSAASGSASSIADLPMVSSLSSTDLVAISQNGVDHAITYSNLLDGETIDEFMAAAPAADTDVFPVGQGTSAMLAQTLAGVWTWIQGHMPGYKQPVVEITVSTTLDASAHNGRILIVSQPGLTLTHSGNEGSGFNCTVINVSSGNVSFDNAVVTTSGVNMITPGQMADVFCAAYSGGTVTYAWMSGPLASPAPGQVTGLATGTITYSTIAVSWSAPASGGMPTSYTLQYRQTGTAPWTSLVATTTSATIFGLAAATEYDVSVIGSNAGGNGPAAAIVNATTAAAPTVVPGQVIGLVASGAAASAVNLAWSAPSSGGTVGSYTILYRVTGQSGWITFATNVPGTIETVTGLTNSTGYDFAVYAVNSAGNGLQSATAAATTTVAPPASPNGLTVGAVTQTTAPMSWTAPLSGGAVATYTLQWRVTGSSGWTQQTGITATGATIGGLASGTEYDVQVAAGNAGGTSAFTTIVNATTTVATPGTPSGLTAGLTTNTAQALSWTAPTTGGAPASYSVRYSVHSANSWTTISGVIGTSFTVNAPLTANTSYDFEVAAVNAGGTSVWAGPATMMTTNYLLSEGFLPGANVSWAHGSSGNGVNVNANVEAGGGSHTQPNLVQFAYGTSNTLAPTSGWIGGLAVYNPGAGQLGYPGYYYGGYVTAPAAAGTWRLWFQALDVNGNVQAQYCSTFIVTAT